MKAKIQALLDQVNSGKLEKDLAKLLRAFINHPNGLTLFELGKGMEFKQNTLNGRLCDLLNMGLIYPDGKVTYTVENGKKRVYTLYKYETNQLLHIHRAEERRIEMFNEKIDSLERRFPDLLNEYLESKGL